MPRVLHFVLARSKRAPLATIPTHTCATPFLRNTFADWPVSSARLPAHKQNIFQRSKSRALRVNTGQGAREETGGLAFSYPTARAAPPIKVRAHNHTSSVK